MERVPKMKISKKDPGFGRFVTTAVPRVVRDSQKSEVAHFGRFSSKNYYGKPYSNRNFGVFGCRIFKKRKVFGEKIEKIKIASKHFKDCPWATQSPNMSFQLPLGPKIIAGEIWSRDFWGVTRVLDHFQWDSHWKWLRFSRESQISSDFCSGDGAAIIFGHRRS